MKTKVYALYKGFYEQEYLFVVIYIYIYKKIIKKSLCQKNNEHIANGFEKVVVKWRWVTYTEYNTIVTDCCKLKQSSPLKYRCVLCGILLCYSIYWYVYVSALFLPQGESESSFSVCDYKHVHPVTELHVGKNMLSEYHIITSLQTSLDVYLTFIGNFNCFNCIVHAEWLKPLFSK